MSWLTDLQQQIISPESSDTFVQKSNVVEPTPFVQIPNGVTTRPERPEKSWLMTAKNDMEASIDTESLGEKGKKWLQDISDIALEQTTNPQSLLRQGPVGVNEAMQTLAVDAVTFMPSLIAGISKLGYEKIRNLVVPEDIERSPQEILDRVKKTTHILPGLLPQPVTEVGKEIVSTVGEGFEKLMKGPVKIGKEMGEFYGPNVGWLSEQVLILAMFKVMHVKGKELTTGVKKLIDMKPPLGGKSAKRVKVESELDSLIGKIDKAKNPDVHSAEFLKIKDQLDAIVLAENAYEISKWQEAQIRKGESGLTLEPHKAMKPSKLPEPPTVELPEAARKIMEFAKSAQEHVIQRTPISVAPIEPKARPKIKKLDLDRIKKEAEKRIGKPILEKVPSKPKKLELKSTEEADAYGAKTTKKQREELATLSEESNAKVLELKKAGDLQGAMKEATRGQLYREALDTAEKIRKPKPEVKIPDKSIMDTLKEKKPISEAEGKLEKQNLKDQITKGVISGEYKGAIRFTTASELKNAIIKRKFTPSKEYDNIHAQPIIEGLFKEDVSFAAYGDYTKHNVAILFPEKAVKTKPDAHTSEVLIDPDVKLTDVKFFIGNQKKPFTYSELITKMGKKPKLEIKVEPKPKPKVEPKKETIKWRAQGKQFTSAVKANIEVAKEMGIMAEIKEALGKGKNSKEIIEQLNRGEYYADDLKDLGYNIKDIRQTIQAVDIIELNNPKAIERLKKSLEQEGVKPSIKPAPEFAPGVKKVDPEKGREPGVETPKKKIDLGTEDVIAAHRIRQEPIKFETGELAKSKFMAERTANEQGLIGELIKDPNSEGWLVRPTKTQRRVIEQRLKSEWDIFLKQEDALMERKAREEIEPGETLEAGSWDSLMNILKGERGAIDLDVKDLGKIKDFIKSKRLPNIDAQELLLAKGLSMDQIKKVLIKPISVRKPNIVEADPESQWLKPGQNPNQLLPRRKLKGVYTAPAVSRRDARIIEQTPNISKPFLGEKIRHLATSEGIFTEIGKPIRELFYRKITQGEKKSSDIATGLIKESKRLRKTLPIKGRYKSLERIDNYAISRQVNGKERLVAQGVKIVDKLNPKEQIVYNRLQELYQDLYTRINEVRRSVGQAPFPPVKNYSAWIHDLSKLNHMENASMLAPLKSLQAGLKRVSEFPSKRDLKGRILGFKGHEKFRGGPEVPGHLKLNALDNFNSYALIAGDILGKSEPIAYMHELLHPRFELYKNAHNTYNFLNEWLDYQKGIESIMYVTNPKTRRLMSKLSGNAAVSFITYAPKSAVVQFSSLNNSIAEIGLPRMIQGISKLINSVEIKRASKISNVLTIRTPEAILMEAANTFQTIPGKVGRILHEGRRKIRAIGTVPLGLTDSIVSYSTWLGAETKGTAIFKRSPEYQKLDTSKRQKATENYARDYADDIVVRAQGSAARSARAPIQRTAEGKFISTLQTFVIANFDYLSRHVLGIKNPDIKRPEQIVKIMNWVLASTAISAGFEQLGWKSPIPTPIKAFQESIEMTNDKVKATKEAAKEILEFIPIYGGKYRYGSELLGVVTDQLVKLGQGDMTAIPRLMGVEGFSTMLKGYRAYKRDGTAADILMGRYIKKPGKVSGGLKGLLGVGGL